MGGQLLFRNSSRLPVLFALLFFAVLSSFVVLDCFLVSGFSSLTSSGFAFLIFSMVFNTFSVLGPARNFIVSLSSLYPMAILAAIIGLLVFLNIIVSMVLSRF